MIWTGTFYTGRKVYYVLLPRGFRCRHLLAPHGICYPVAQKEACHHFAFWFAVPDNNVLELSIENNEYVKKPAQSRPDRIVSFDGVSSPGHSRHIEHRPNLRHSYNCCVDPPLHICFHPCRSIQTARNAENCIAAPSSIIKKTNYPPNLSPHQARQRSIDPSAWRVQANGFIYSPKGASFVRKMSIDTAKEGVKSRESNRCPDRAPKHPFESQSREDDDCCRYNDDCCR
jgi:hypothetical protein